MGDVVKVSPKYDLNYKGYRLKAIYYGLKEDIQTFYSLFVSKNNFSFSTFAETWKELKFYSIFWCRKNPKEILEFTEGVLHYSKGFMFGTLLSMNIFGIYLIYATYLKQVVRNSAKLRLTKDEVDETLCLVKKLEAENCFDPICIIKRLYTCGGINFVLAPLEAGFDEGFKKYFGTSADYPSFRKAEPFDVSLLDTFEHITNVYAKKKKELFDPKDMFFQTSELVPSTRKALQRLNKTGGSAGEPHIESEAGSSRQSIKSRAFSSAVPKAADAVIRIGNNQESSSEPMKVEAVEVPFESF